MEAHRNFFKEVNGVPSVMVYDNMKIAVTIRSGGRGRPSAKFPTKTMQRLSLYYGFKERFCNARAGWEKGAVERSVNIVRHEAFVSRQSFETIDDAQAWLNRTLDRINALSGISGVSDADKKMRTDADLRALMPAPQPMGCFEAEDHTPGKYCTVMVDSNNYSVPETLVSQSITVKVYSNHLAMYHNGRKVAEHARLYGKGLWSMKLEHFLSTFLRKPRALDQSVALRQVPAEIAELYRVHFCPDRQKGFVTFMMYARDNGILHSEIMASVRRLRGKDIRHITEDHLKVDIAAASYNTTADSSGNPYGADAEELKDIESHALGTLEQLTGIMNSTTFAKPSYN